MPLRPRTADCAPERFLWCGLVDQCAICQRPLAHEPVEVPGAIHIFDGSVKEFRHAGLPCAAIRRQCLRPGI